MDLIGFELVENPFFALPEILIKRFKSSSGQVKVTNQYVYNSSNRPSKQHRPFQAEVMHLPGLGGHAEIMLPIVTKYMRNHIKRKIYEKSYMRTICAKKL